MKFSVDNWNQNFSKITNFRFAFGSVYIGVIATKIGHMKQGSVSRVSKCAFYPAESFDKIDEFCKTTEINL